MRVALRLARRPSFIPALALATLVAPVFAPAETPPRYYSISDLGPGDAYRNQNLLLGYTVGALDGSACPGAAGGRFGFYWDGWTGLRQNLCPLAGDATASAFDFEMLGYKSAVGYSRSPSGNDRPVIWYEQADGSFAPSPMGLPGGSPGGVAWATTFWGDSAGEVTVGGERRAAYWLIPSWSPTVFPLTGTSAVFSVGGSGETITAGHHEGRFLLWYPYRSTNAFSYPLGETQSVAYRVRGDWTRVTAVGQAGSPGSGQGFVWQSDAGLTLLPSLGGGDSTARDFWNVGRIVGSSQDAGGQPHAALWEGPALWDLNDMKLPTCRDDNAIACAPWTLESANSVSDPGVIVGTGILDGVRHAFLAKPVEMLTWNASVCAETSQPLCVAQPAHTSTDLVIDQFLEKQKTPLSDSAAHAYAAAAHAEAEDHSIWIPNSAASFRSYAVFEQKSVMDYVRQLPGGQTALGVRFHFKVDGMASGGSGQSSASASAGVALRASRGWGEYGSVSGSISALGGAVTRTGIFAGQGAGSTGDVEVPMQLQPFGTDALEVRIEGGSGASTLAFGPTWASADVSVLFCSEDPRSITLADGTPLMDVGIKYTLWPTVRRSPDEKDRCRNPLKDLPNETPTCQGGGSGGEGSSFLGLAPTMISAGQEVELQGVGRPGGGQLTATVLSGNATVVEYRPCTNYPDGTGRCPVVIRAADPLEPDAVVAVRLTYSYDNGGSSCQFEKIVTLLGPRLEFVDPIDGNAPPLIDSATPFGSEPIQFLRRDPQLLATAGRPVRGLAADGVTPVIIRFRAPGPGAVTFTVADDRGSRSPARAGLLADPFGVVPTYANPVTVATRQVGAEYWAFAVLTAPRDFVRPDVLADLGRGHENPRELPVRADFVSSASAPPLRVTRGLELVRPPVTLLHGIWSDAGTWKWPLKDDKARFYTHAHDYRLTSGMSYLVNYRQARKGVQDTLLAFRLEGFAATQVDTIAHSMGAILTRLYIGGRAFGENLGLPPILVRAIAPVYEQSVNYGAGTVHKLVMVDSPQFGSPVANFLVDNPKYRLGLAIVKRDLRVLGRAVEDLQRDGRTTLALPTVAVPVHAMIGETKHVWDVSMWLLLKLIDKLQNKFDVPGWIQTFLLNVYLPEPDHDLIVGSCSQKAGLPLGGAAGVVTDNIVQSIHFKNTSSSDYNALAITLLNSPVELGAFAPGLVRPVKGRYCEAWTPDAPPPPVESVPPVPEDGPPTPPVVEGGLVVTSPPTGTIATAGSDVQVTVEPSGGFAPTRIIVTAGSGEADVVGSRFEGALHIPETEVGDVELIAMGFDADDQMATSSPVVLHVQVSATLTALSLQTDRIVLDAGTPTAPIVVSGIYDDGITRDVTSSTTGTTYESQNPQVVTVDADGVLTAVKRGKTLVRVANAGQEAIEEVTVTTTPFDADSDGDVDVVDFLRLRACQSAFADDQIIDPPLDACRDTFDADRDGDVDANDFPAFLARYTGPQADCNGNGEIDISDIVAGTSQDANANGIPDECEGN